METTDLFSVTGVLLFVLGMWGLSTLQDHIRKVIALNILSVGVFLILVAIAYRGEGSPADPVPHAMVLTGIVVSVSATAVALTLIARLAVDTESKHDNNPIEKSDDVT